MGFTTGRKRACWSSLSRAGSQKQHSTLSFHCPTEAQPPGRTGKDWLDGGMNGWIDTKESEGLVNKHLRADTLPAGMESDSETEKKASDETERKYRWGNSFSITRQKSTKTVSRINRLTEEGKLKEMKTRKKKECWDKDSLFLRTVRATGIKTHMLHVWRCLQAHSVEAHLGFSSLTGCNPLKSKTTMQLPGLCRYIPHRLYTTYCKIHKYLRETTKKNVSTLDTAHCTKSHQRLSETWHPAWWYLCNSAEVKSLVYKKTDVLSWCFSVSRTWKSCQKMFAWSEIIPHKNVQVLCNCYHKCNQVYALCAFLNNVMPFISSRFPTSQGKDKILYFKVASSTWFDIMIKNLNASQTYTPINCPWPNILDPHSAVIQEELQRQAGGTVSTPAFGSVDQSDALS